MNALVRGRFSEPFSSFSVALRCLTLLCFRSSSLVAAEAGKGLRREINWGDREAMRIIVKVAQRLLYKSWFACYFWF